MVWLIFLSSALYNFGSFCDGPNVFSSFCEHIVYANGFYLLLEVVKYPQCFVVVICQIVIYALGLLCSPIGVVLIGAALIYLGLADFNWSVLDSGKYFFRNFSTTSSQVFRMLPLNE